MKTKLLLHGTRISMLIMIILAGSLSRTFAQQGIIYSDGLNGSSSVFAVSGGTYYANSSGNNGSGDRPSNSPFYSEGANGYGKSNGVATLTSSVMNTSLYSNVQLSLDLAAFAIGSSGDGMDANDVVTIGINTDGSNTFTTILTVTGNNNAYWAFNATGVASVNYPSTATFAPSASAGNKTTDGYSKLLISKLPSTATLRVKITMTNNSNNERWVVDNFQITGITTKTWVGINNAPWGTAGNWSPNGVPGAGDSVVFNTSRAVSVNVDPASIRALTITNSSTVTLAPSSNTDRTLTLANGSNAALSVGAGSTLTVDGYNGGFGNTSAFTLGITTGNGSTIAGSLNLNGTGDNGNFTLSGGSTNVTGTITSNGGALTSSNAPYITFASGSNYFHATNGGVAPNATWNTGSKATFTGITSTAPAITSPGGFANFVWNCAGQTGDISFAGSLGSVSGDFTLTSTNGHSLRLINSGTANVTSIGGNFVQTGGIFYLLGAGGSGTSSTMNVAGNFSLSGSTSAFVMNGATTGSTGSNGAILKLSGDFSITAGSFQELASSTYASTVNFAKSGTQTFTSGASMSGTIDFVVASGSTLQMGTSAAPAIISSGISGKFTLAAGATLGVTSPAGISSTGATGNIQSTGTRLFTGSTSSYIYNGSAAQQTGNGLPAIVSNLIINNAAGVTPTQALAIGGQLTLVAGKFNSSNINLTMNSGSSVVGGSSSSYIVTGNGSAGTGSFIRNLAAGTLASFPIGTSAYYLPVSVKPVTASVFATSVFQGATTNGMPTGTQFSNKTNIVDAVWNVERTTGSGNADLTIQWDAALEGATFANFASASIGISHFTGGAWDNAAQIAADAAANTVTNTYSSFSPFGVGAISTPLPVILVDFNAVMNKSRTVDLSWSTQQEVNSSHFDVQRSADGSSWSTIGTVQAKGNASYVSNYSFNDASPVGTVDYYRLKMVDRDGKFGYTDIKLVRLSIIGNISIFPNPTKDFVNVTLSGSSSEQTVKLINLNGQVLQEKKVNSLTGSTISLAVHNYAQGDYFIQVVGADGSQQVSKIVVTR